MKIFYDLSISVLGGIISGLILTWIFKAEFKNVLSKEAFRRIFSKELILIVALVIFVSGYFILVKKGVIPPYEFRDDVVLYDLKGNECVKDLFHPDRGCKPTGRKKDLDFDKSNAHII